MRRLAILFILLACAALPVDVHHFMLDRLNRFNRDMRMLTDILRAGFVLPLETERRLSREWREVETSGEWPRYQEAGCTR